MNKTPREIMVELNTKFNSNFTEWTRLAEPGLDKVFGGLYCIAEVGEILNDRKTSKHHAICCKIYDEIFADGVSSIYLAANAMDKPARIVLRRILEMGIAAVYLWDMPHKAFAWNQRDGDLSFSEMISHLNSDGFRIFVAEDVSATSPITELVPSSLAQRLYGSLSDIVHGKITTFETAIPDRFSFSETDWSEFVVLAEQVVFLILDTILKRFNLREELKAKLPHAKRIL